MTDEHPFPLPGREQALHLLREMLRIRRFEEKSAELYSSQKIRGFLHLYVGEEAIATGVMENLRADDAIVATYREHGHALARGVDMGAIMAEMYGKQEGCSRGRGGSMHLFDARTRFYGGNAIVGGGIPLAVGLAMASKMQGSDAIAVCFFGEGAVAEGEFHESLNLAAVWGLPVLFACENNGYAMGTALARSESQVDLQRKAASYNVHAEAVDGMDVLAVADATRRAVEQLRRGEGPVFLEFRTYRFRAHSMYDAQLYRDNDEIERWKKHGPLVRFEARLRSAELLDDSTLAAIEAEVAREVEAAVAFAEAGTWEPVGDLTKDVYCERGQR